MAAFARMTTSTGVLRSATPTRLQQLQRGIDAKDRELAAVLVGGRRGIAPDCSKGPIAGMLSKPVTRTCPRFPAASTAATAPEQPWCRWRKRSP